MQRGNYSSEKKKYRPLQKMTEGSGLIIDPIPELTEPTEPPTRLFLPVLPQLFLLWSRAGRLSRDAASVDADVCCCPDPPRPCLIRPPLAYPLRWLV